MSAGSVLQNQIAHFRDRVVDIQALTDSTTGVNGNGTSALFADPLRDLRQALAALSELRSENPSQRSICSQALQILTDGLDDLLDTVEEQLRFQDPKSEIIESGSNASSSSRNDLSFGGRVRLDQQRSHNNTEIVYATLEHYQAPDLVFCYSHAINLLNEVLKRQTNTSETHNPQHARLAARSCLDQLLDTSSQTPTLSVVHGYPPRSHPSVIRSQGAAYGEFQVALLRRLETSLDNARTRYPLSGPDHVWNQRHIIYWSAQADWLRRKCRADSRNRWQYSQQLVLAALRTTWLGQLDLNNLRSIAVSNPIVVNVASAAIQHTCSLLQQSFEYALSIWTPQELVELGGSEQELSIPNLRDRLRQTTRNEYESSNTSSSTSGDVSSLVSTNSNPRLYELPGLGSSTPPSLSNIPQNAGFPALFQNYNHQPTSRPPAFLQPSVHSSQTSYGFVSSGPNGFANITQQPGLLHPTQPQRSGYPSVSNIPDDCPSSAPSIRHRRPVGMFSIPSQPSTSDEILPVTAAFSRMQVNDNSQNITHTRTGQYNPGSISENSGQPRNNAVLHHFGEYQMTEKGVGTSSRPNAKPLELDVETQGDFGPSNSGRWVPSRVRVFKAQSHRGEVIRISIDHLNGEIYDWHFYVWDALIVPPQALGPATVQRHIIQLVRSDYSHLILRFTQKDARDNETLEDLMSFQSAIVGATVDQEFPVGDIVLNGPTNNPTRLRAARVQLWIDENIWSLPVNNIPSPRADASYSTRRDRNIPLRDTYDCFDGGKLFIFASGSIYVLLITDRIRYQRSESETNTLKLLPNRCSALRISKIEASPQSPAMIPVEQTGLSFGDIDGPHFADYKSLQISFPGLAILDGFVEELEERIEKYRTRPSRQRLFREHERNSRLTTQSIVVSNRR